MKGQGREGEGRGDGGREGEGEGDEGREGVGEGDKGRGVGWGRGEGMGGGGEDGKGERWEGKWGGDNSLIIDWIPPFMKALGELTYNRNGDAED